MRAAFDALHDVALTDVEAARTIHDARIDILIDPKGYTRGARTGIMMLRPAPVHQPLGLPFRALPGTIAPAAPHIVANVGDAIEEM